MKLGIISVFAAGILGFELDYEAPLCYDLIPEGAVEYLDERCNSSMKLYYDYCERMRILPGYSCTFESTT